MTAARGRGQWLWTPFLVVLLGLLSIVMLVWIDRVGERQRMDFARANALMAIRMRATTAHLSCCTTTEVAPVRGARRPGAACRAGYLNPLQHPLGLISHIPVRPCHQYLSLFKNSELRLRWVLLRCIYGADDAPCLVRPALGDDKEGFMRRIFVAAAMALAAFSSAALAEGTIVRWDRVEGVIGAD